MDMMTRQGFVRAAGAFAFAPFTGTLFAADEKPLFRMGVMTDTHVGKTPESCSRLKAALELFKAGLYTDPATGQLTRSGRLALMDAFNIGSWENMTTMDELQRQEAQRENQLNEEGTTPVISELDDTEIHVFEHTKYAYSAAFRELEKNHPEAADRLMRHIREHKDMQQRQAAHQISAQNAEIEAAARQKIELEAMTQETAGGNVNA
jgi:hypothetical protein